MELRNSFTVPGTPDDVFGLLLDLERVALCMPGASLTGRDGDRYTGTLKLKVGPIGAAYEGTVEVAEVDRTGRSATLRAAGRDMTGQGGAQATIHANVDGNGDGSRVSVVTDVAIHGKAAQFGRGALGDVTQRIIDQFAKNLEARLIAGDLTPGAVAVTEPAPGAPSQERPAAAVAAAPADDTLNLMSVAALPLVKQAAPVLAGAVAGLLVGLLLGRRRSPRHTAPTVVWPPGWPPPGPMQ